MRLSKFTGLNTIDSPLDVGIGGLTSVKNMDIDHNGKLSTRNGFTKILNTPIIAMNGGIVLCANGDLLRINHANSIETLAQGIIGNTICCVDIAGNTYFSTGNYNGVISGSAIRAMGLLPPQVEFSVSLGNLPAGNYLISATSVSEDGRESGSNAAQVVGVGDNSSISVLVDLPSDATTANIYASGQNGEELFYQTTSTHLTLTGLDALLNSGEPINREYKGMMPTGQLIEEYNGHLLIADNENLYFSEPLDYELCDYMNNIIPFDSQITMIRSVTTGVYVSTSKEVLFASGDTPDKWVFRQAYPFPAYFNSSKMQPASLVGQGGIGRSAIFVTPQGICIGNQDGIVTNVSERKIKLLPHTGNVSAVVKHNIYMVSLS